MDFILQVCKTRTQKEIGKSENLISSQILVSFLAPNKAYANTTTDLSLDFPDKRDAQATNSLTHKIQNQTPLLLGVFKQASVEGP